MSIENQNQPENLPQSREFAFDELMENQPWLKVGDTITDIPDGDGLNQLETFLVNKLHTGSLPRHNEILNDPLQRALKPKNFHGELVNCSAIILPTPSFGRYSSIRGTRLLIAGDMQSSGRGVVGHFMRPITYRNSPPTGASYDRQYSIVRKIESNKNQRQIEEMVELLNQESSIIAHKVASLAIKHAFSAGAPTLGKR